MSNYTQTNIYRKQMQELGLNTKQYAELIEMPYEVVKDIIYDKEGDYSMEIKSLLRKNMMNRHQEIENNFENAKIKALELKQENNSMNWYINEYTPEMLKEKLNLKSRKAFEEKYDIIIDDKRASHWFYTCILGKTNYDNHEIRKDVVEQFVEQLYDILANGNDKKHLHSSKYPVTQVKNKKITSVLKWFKKFDIKKYLQENDLTQIEFCKKVGIDGGTLSRLIKNQKKLKYETESIKKIYNYLNNIVNENVSYDKTTEAQEQDILENTLLKLRQEEQPIFMTTKEEPKIELLENDIIRRLLATRLTDEERALIELFGGKIC